MGCDALPCLHEFLKRTVLKSHEDVDVVWHNDEAVQVIEIFVTVEEAFGDDLRVTFFAEKAFAHALVEPVLELSGEGGMVFFFGFVSPGLWMFFEPSFSFGFPFDNEGLGDRVGESPGDEDVGVRLLPVGKVVVVDGDLFVWVEEHWSRGALATWIVEGLGCGAGVDKWRGATAPAPMFARFSRGRL